MSNWNQAYTARDDLKEYGDNGLALFALALHFRIDDIDSVAAESITDGHDDKKCDLVYINEEEEFAVLAQCYSSSKARQEAPANKASDLNIALAWLLQRNLPDVPERIKSSAQQIRASITQGKIKTLYVWYVHNLPSSANVAQELITVQQTATTILNHDFEDAKVQVHAMEVGAEKLTEWYSESLSPILVDETFNIKVSDGGYEIKGDNWSSFCTTIQGRDLARAYRKHKLKIFSANVRDYLGSRSSDSNINNGIRTSAENAASEFWAYNNGVTILVHEYKFDEIAKNLEVKGMSIVNGAQTTGALGTLQRLPPESVKVQARFIKVNDADADLIQNIIQYNNSQNKVEASDFRSTDKIQKRLKSEFASIPDAEYDGGRRGGAESAIRRKTNLLPSYTVGQALMSFHGEPTVAYNQRSAIWTNDSHYSKIFNESTKASHIVCAYSLMRCIENKKIALAKKDSLSKNDSAQLGYLRHRGSIPLLCSAIAECLENFLGRPVPNLFRVSFGNTISPSQAESIWEPIVDVCLALSTQLLPALIDGGLKSPSKVKDCISNFSQLITATAQMNQPVYEAFEKKIKSAF
ncbi:AIPR family protein [Cronobacter sakazakii]|nr:AIPR family protein [Cronobacter sakazakii]ELY4406091.1 AIPR family protein [Cronobacter sakazakii]ELY4465415.1 AIPR family protein [Cronobacter sakazakii]ELY5895043.1 AIPR family protein [Cronobacter sakazakii]